MSVDVKKSNCLTKNLLEMDSLPQIKNLLEMSETATGSEESLGVENEADDEATTGGDQSDCGEVSASGQEGEETDPG